MSKTMSFWEAVRKGIINEGDTVNPIELFSDSNKEVILTEEETGYNIPQKFVREENLEWIFEKDYQGIPTLFASRTKFPLHLRGVEGYVNGISTFHKISSVYSNLKIGCIARALKVEDVNYFDKMEFFHSLPPYLLASFEIDEYVEDKGCLWMKLLYVEEYDVCCASLKFPDGGNGHFAYGFRPVISISTSKILVDIESMERDGAWKLLPPTETK